MASPLPRMASKRNRSLMLLFEIPACGRQKTPFSINSTFEEALTAIQLNLECAAFASTPPPAMPF